MKQGASDAKKNFDFANQKKVEQLYFDQASSSKNSYM